MKKEGSTPLPDSTRQLSRWMGLVPSAIAYANNIDASGTADWYGAAGFAPIGTLSTRFTGVFDGLGHVIGHLTINRSAQDDVGLFGYATGTLRNIGLTDASISGRNYVGTLAGRTNSNISNSYARGTVTGQDDTGGLVGRSEFGSIGDAWFAGSVVGTGDRVGGLVGFSSANVARSYAAATVTGRNLVGGLVGWNFSATIAESFASGTVTANGNVAGGLVGEQQDGSIRNAWFAGSVTGGSAVGGLVGYSNLGNITRTYADAVVSSASSVGGLVGESSGSLSSSLITASFHTGRDNGIGTATTPANLQQLSTFAAWGANIDDAGGTGATWRIYEGHTTPLLRAFLTPLTVTVNDSAGKTYDGSIGSGVLDASQYALSDSAASVQGSLSFATSGDNAGAYSVGAGSLLLNGLYSNQLGYDISYADASTYTIARRALNITGAVARDREYDGTLAAMVSGGTLDGLVFGDVVDLTLGGAQFGDKNAGTGKSVTVSGSALSGADADNYTVTDPIGLTVNITPRAISGNITAGDKVYDGTTAATVAGALTGVIAGDDVEFTASGAFADKNAGTGKTVSVSGALSGTDASNYTLSSNSTTTASITPRSLVLNASSDRRTYDGTTASSDAVGVDGLVQGDTISALTQSFDSRNAGQRTAAVNAGYVIDDGAGGSNYTVTTNTAVGTIDRALLTLTPSELQRLFGVPFAFEGDEFEIDSGRLFAGDRIDSVRLTSDGASVSAAPGSYAIQIADAQGVGLNNYLINYVSAPSGLQVLGSANTVDALGDTLASLYERQERLEVPTEVWPLLEVVNGGMRLPAELSGDEQARR